MSASTELQALLVGAAGVAALVGTRVFSDRAEQKTARPFIVHSVAQTEPQYSLDNTEHGRLTVFEVQVWANKRASAEAVADAIEQALADDQRVILAKAGGYDEELDLEATVLSVEWWT